MFSDIWPSGTWAIVDYYLTPKAAYFASKRAFEQVAPIITKIKEDTALYVVNDSLEEVCGELTLRYTDAKGNVSLEKVYDVKAAANESTRLEVLNDMIQTGSNMIFTAELKMENKTVKTFYYPDLWKNIRWSNPELEVNIEHLSDKCATITITAKSAFARMVNVVTPDLVGTEFSDNFFDMEKGETKVVKVKADAPFAAEDIKVLSWVDEWER